MSDDRARLAAIREKVHGKREWFIPDLIADAVWLLAKVERLDTLLDKDADYAVRLTKAEAELAAAQEREARLRTLVRNLGGNPDA